MPGATGAQRTIAKLFLHGPGRVSVQHAEQTDTRDAALIARCLATRTYHAVHIPTKEDEQVKEFLRMRTDQSLNLKKTKQQILAFCLRHGLQHKGTNWTEAHMRFLRRLIVEAANGICKGSIGYKSKDLKARQSGNLPEVIAYADKANERLRRKYYKLLYKGKPKNVSKTAVARELACFIWGMMTDNISEGAAT